MNTPAEHTGAIETNTDVAVNVDSPGRLTRWSSLFADTFGIVPAFMWRKFIRLAGVMTLDFIAVAGTFFLLLPFIQPRVSLAGWLDTLPLIALSASALTVALLYLSGLYRRSWRFTSLTDCIAMGFNIGFALAITWSAIWWSIGSPRSLGDIALLGLFHFCLAFLTMQIMRLSRRAVRYLPLSNIAGKNGDAAERKNVILVGPATWAESIIKFTKSEASAPVHPVGVLLPEADGPIVQIHGVQVLGFPENLPTAIAILEQRGRRPETIVLCEDSVNMSPREVATVTGRARDLGITVSRVGDDWGQLLGRDTAPNLDKLSTSDLLGRREFELREAAISQQIAGETVLVTGAGGTIGSELVRQLAGFKPSKIVLLDHSEYGLYAIEKQIREDFPEQNLAIELCNIRNPIEVRRAFGKHNPAIVYHAAALKHVPIVEGNPCAGVHTNVIGTKNIADAVTEFNARAMVQVSTDKAVNPVGMMGATKRVGELYAQSLDLCGVDDPEAPRFMTVRFGNVLGSSGSVVPLFKQQLLAGGPLTVTHPDIERFFMTVAEAVQLILESSSRALHEDTPRGRIMVLDMGEPVKIVDLAKRMIRIYGLEPDVDVAISFTGLRPGEKLFEELFDSCEEQDESDIPGIFEASSNPIPLPFITRAIEQLGLEVDAGNDSNVRRITHHLTTLPSSGDSLAGYVATSDAFLRSPRFKTVEEA
ncbi:MAG: nucleoside-diphosphate sugar epimerase/dehydratase [Pseudomonadota bacterium]